MLFCTTNFRIGWAVLGIVAGGSAGPIFAWRFSNYSATSFALISAVLAAFTLYLHVCYKRGRLDEWRPAHFYYPRLLGCCTMLLGMVSLVVFLVLGGVLQQGLTGRWLYGENFWIAAVWGWMTLKWGFMVFWYSHKYGRLCQHGEQSRLLDEKQSHGHDEHTY